MPATSTQPQGVDLFKEVYRCRQSPAHFLRNHVWLKDDTAAAWLPFDPWQAQRDTLDVLRRRREVVILKARQLGFTWLCLGYALHTLLFRPRSTVLLFSKRDDEAVELLSVRLQGMYARLPDWMLGGEPGRPRSHDWTLPNGSRAKAFPTTGGRSYTGTLAIVDEADWVENLDGLLNAVKPTVDAGGQLLLLSSPDKSKPESPFKRIFRAARAGENSYAPVFHGWDARPGRTPQWYAAQRQDVFARTGSYDDCEQEYPATEAEALAPRSLDKRIPPAWLAKCHQPEKPRRLCPAVPGLEVYRPPREGLRVCLGADPAEGNPQSDDSALTVLDAATGEQCATLAGRYEPGVFSNLIEQVAQWYGGPAPLMVERNNHGHAVLLWLRDHARAARVLWGWDQKPGWLSSSKGKVLLYDTAAEAFRDGCTVLHGSHDFHQLSSIEGATLRAPEGQHDDRADAYALALRALRTAPARVAVLDMGAKPPDGRSPPGAAVR